MALTNLNVEINSINRNFLIESKDVSKIYVVFPIVFCDVSSELVETKENKNLKIYDEFASSNRGNKNLIQSLYHPNPFTKTIRIIVPTNSISNLNVNLENGNLFLKNIALAEASISLVKGNLEVKKSSLDNATINGYISDIKLDQVQGNNIITSTKTGTINVKETMTKKLLLETELGNVELEMDSTSFSHTQLELKTKSLKRTLYPTRNIEQEIICRTVYGTIKNNIF